jgi:hypothetical protein
VRVRRRRSVFDSNFDVTVTIGMVGSWNFIRGVMDEDMKTSKEVVSKDQVMKMANGRKGSFNLSFDMKGNGVSQLREHKRRSSSCMQGKAYGVVA